MPMTPSAVSLPRNESHFSTTSRARLERLHLAHAQLALGKRRATEQHAVRRAVRREVDDVAALHRLHHRRLGGRGAELLARRVLGPASSP